MKVRKALRPYIQWLEELGWKVEDIALGGSTHYRIAAERHGVRRKFTVALTPSDHRGFLNWKSNVRRLTRQLDAEAGGTGG